MYKPVEFTIALSFLDEDEDQVQCILTSQDDYGVDVIRIIADDPYEAVLDALKELFNGGDLGDLFWPLQNEDTIEQR